MKQILSKISIIIIATFFASSAAIANNLITLETFIQYSQVAGFEKQYNQMISIFVSSFQNGMLKGFEDSINEKDISMDLKQKISPLVRQSAENIKTNFEKLFKDEVKFKDLIKQVYLPIYRKHFTEREIMELIKFYQSPVGRKLSDLSPIIMQESSTTFNQVYGFRVQRLGGELIKNEVDSLLEKVKTLKSNR